MNARIARWPMVFAGWLMASAAMAAETPTMAALIEEAFTNNPAVQAARAEWEQAIERHPQATALPDPMLRFSYFAENVETRVGPQQFSVGVSQDFPFPGTLGQRGKVVEKEMAIAELRYERALRDTIAELKQALYELKYIDGAIEITQQNQDLLQEIVSLAQTQQANEKTPLSDVFRAESQLAQLDYDLVTLRELRVVQRSVVNAVLNRNEERPLTAYTAPLPRPATVALNELENLAYKQNQEIRLAQLGVEKAEENIRLARKENLPTFSLGATYIETGEAVNPNLSDSSQDAVILSGGISIPLWFQKNKAKVRHAKAARQAQQNREQESENQIRVQLRKTYFKLENARRLIELYQDHLLPEARQSMELAEEWNREGGGTVAELIETESVWLNFQLAALRARVDYGKAWAELERVAGGTLSPVLPSKEKAE